MIGFPPNESHLILGLFGLTVSGDWVFFGVAASIFFRRKSSISSTCWCKACLVVFVKDSDGTNFSFWITSGAKGLIPVFLKHAMILAGVIVLPYALEAISHIGKVGLTYLTFSENDYRLL